MKIYVISSPDPIRQKNVRDQFMSQEGNWSYECVEAIMNPSQSSVGIMRSFKKCVTLAKERGEPRVAIFEDDLKFTTEDSLLRFIELGVNMPKGSLFLGGFYEGEPIEENRTVCRVGGKLSGLHAVILREDMYDAILQAEEPYHLDYWLSQIKNVPIYSAYPILVLQQDGYSFNAGTNTKYTESLHLKYKIYGK